MTTRNNQKNTQDSNKQDTKSTSNDKSSSSSDKSHSGKQGFATMPKEQVKEIAAEGGRHSHDNTSQKKNKNSKMIIMRMNSYQNCHQ